MHVINLLLLLPDLIRTERTTLWMVLPRRRWCVAAWVCMLHAKAGARCEVWGNLWQSNTTVVFERLCSWNVLIPPPLVPSHSLHIYPQTLAGSFLSVSALNPFCQLFLNSVMFFSINKVWLKQWDSGVICTAFDSQTVSCVVLDSCSVEPLRVGDLHVVYFCCWLIVDLLFGGKFSL